MWVTTEEKNVTVKLVTDRLSTILQLEVRVYITTTFDCELKLEAGSAKGVLDSGVEVDLQSGAQYRQTIYLGDGDKMSIRVRAESEVLDAANFVANDHASKLTQKLPKDPQGRNIRVTIQKAKQHRQYQGRKRSRWLV